MDIKFSKNQINKAGEILKDRENYDDVKIIWAEDVLTFWRTLHGYPINTFQATLRDKIKLLNKEALVAQRLKRAPSIISKLQRNENMLLSRMQDISGVRAVLKTIKDIRELEENYKKSKFKHELTGGKDYIQEPKSSEYRGIHLIYKYVNPTIESANGLKIELQIRTKLQHTWATAVETMGTFLDYSLKSSEGPQRWLDFFSMTSSAFAFFEKSEPVPG